MEHFKSQLPDMPLDEVYKAYEEAHETVVACSIELRRRFGCVALMGEDKDYYEA